MYALIPSYYAASGGDCNPERFKRSENKASSETITTMSDTSKDLATKIQQLDTVSGTLRSARRIVIDHADAAGKAPQSSYKSRPMFHVTYSR